MYVRACARARVCVCLCVCMSARVRVCGGGGGGGGGCHPLTDRGLHPVDACIQTPLLGQARGQAINAPLSCKRIMYVQLLLSKTTITDALWMCAVRSFSSNPRYRCLLRFTSV